MNSPPSVSIIVPVHNRRELVRRAVESLLEQDFREAYEIVVIDDGSTDGSAEEVDGIDRRVRVVSQPNQGAADARHNGIREARSEVVAFLDSDDLAPPNKLSSLWDALKSHPNCLLSFGVTKNALNPLPSKQRWIEGPLDGRTVVIDEPFQVILGTSEPFAGAMNLMTYRKPALECSAGRSFYCCANDYDFQARMATRGKFVFTATVTCLYDIQSSGVTRTYGMLRQEAFALHSAVDAYRSAPNQAELQQFLRPRVEIGGTRIAIGLALQQDWLMHSRILSIIARHGRLTHLPRSLWWAVDRLVEERHTEISPALSKMVVWGRGIRALCQSVNPSNSRVENP